MPAQATADRLKRILVLVPWVIARGAPTVAEVCERFEMTPRELAEDIDLLLVCGLWPFTPGDYIEAFIDGDRVTIGMAQALERPPRLTRAEAMALLVTGRAVAALPGLEEAGSLRSALGKLARAVAPSDAPEAAELADRIAVSLDSAGAEMVGSLRHAVEERARLRLSYWSAGRAEMTEREVDPLLVFGALGSWYLAALDHRSGEQRLFRVDRIREVSHTGETFEAAEPGVRVSGEGPLYTPGADDVEVVIEVEPAAAWLSEVVAGATVEPLEDGRARLRFRTSRLPWLVGLLLSAGTAARPIAPPELARALQDAARVALARYPSS